MLVHLKRDILDLGKPLWCEILHHLAELHINSIHPPFFSLPYPWEETSHYENDRKLFGNWHTVHIALDALPFTPKHALHQILNQVGLQDSNGLIPGTISLNNNEWKWNHYNTSPPLWPFIIHEYCLQTKHVTALEKCYLILTKQLSWFEKNRQTEDGGFFYVDPLDAIWESGAKESARFTTYDGSEKLACVDATSHLYGLYFHAATWAKQLNRNAESTHWQYKAENLRRFIQEKLFDEQTGFFHDEWSVGNPEKRVLAFEGFWPLVVGAAPQEQAQRVINENLLDSGKFFTEHPIPTVAISDPHFDCMNWNGPTRNSMTYWIAKGCVRYQRKEVALQLLAKALNASTKHFKKTGKIWEYYHPQGCEPQELICTPNSDCTGHNPLIAMANLYVKLENSM